MSGIYIPDMKIPGSCLDCLKIGWHYVFECYLDDAEEGKRLASCPLVPVPPHGDLIDRDALMKRMWEETDCMISVPATFVRDSPTIIPAEEGEG